MTGSFKEDGKYTIPGVKGSGSEVRVAFMEPAGSMTGKLFPTGNHQESIPIDPTAMLPGLEPFSAEVTLIDAANPFVLIDARSIPPLLAGTEFRDTLIETIRRIGAVRMGLAPTVEAAAETRGTPKVALIYAPEFGAADETAPDVRVLSYSMGKPHPSLQLTGAVCIAAALEMPGTVAAKVWQSSVLDEMLMTPETSPSPSLGPSTGEINLDDDKMIMRTDQGWTERKVLIAHPTGVVEVGVVVQKREDGESKIVSCSISRTARRLFEGTARYYIE